MPELPDVVIYCEALVAHVRGEVLQRVQLKTPFVLRTAVPTIASAEGKRVLDVRRLGKRIVLALDDDLFLVVHLMIAGRLRWLDAAAKPPARTTLAILEFRNGRIAFTEAGTKRRASLHLVRGADALAQFDMGGLEVGDSSLADFAERLQMENHTLKRALTDPRLFSGIGNAYSDEILHRARLSPLELTRKLAEGDVARLFDATGQVLSEWTARLRVKALDKFPETVTAFHPEMAVHGRYGQRCPVCGSPVQRIVYAAKECNYCARCQTDGVILADRALSRLLHDSFPRSLDEQ
jgi:formamidopyrimidine-DNA glycosylase